MASLNWTFEPTELIRLFEIQHQDPDAGALFAWAASSVDALHYLDEIDRRYDESNATIGGHRPDVVDVAHARWATGTCITALDLCAAGMGRTFCARTKRRELDLSHFDPANLETHARLARLPVPAQRWVDDVFGDPKYKTIKDARNWLTHSRVKRHFTLNAGGPPRRLQLELGTIRLDVRQVVEDARELATRHVTVFLQLLPRL